MARRRVHGNTVGTLSVDERLLDALETLYGPFDDRKAIEAISDGLEALHKGLTGHRSRFIRRPYLRDAKLLRAYASYVVCAQAPKLRPILDRIHFDPSRPLRILELGCGPGTGVAAVGLWAQDRELTVEHLATDRVPEALEASKRLADALGLQGVTTVQVDLSSPLARQIGRQEKFDLILCMNVLNELPIERFSLLIREFAHWLRPEGHVVAIEPAAREPARHILEIRELFISRDWFVHAPCPHQETCPALEQEDDWCHDAWSFDRPDFMGDVDKRVGTRRESLKATWFILSQVEPPLPGEGTLGRIVSDRFEEKGRTHARVCTAGGLVDLELQKRDRSDSNQDFRDVHRYDLVQFDETETVGRRERLKSTSRCHRVDETK